MRLEDIKDKWENDGDCIRWTGCLANNITPCVRYKGKVQSVRKLLWLARGKPPAKYFATTCQDKRCIRPSHTIALPHGASKGFTYSADARIRHTMARRSRAKLTQADVDAIRASDATQKELAERYGIGLSNIQKIIYRTAWRDLSSPFAGLGA